MCLEIEVIGLLSQLLILNTHFPYGSYQVRRGSHVKKSKMNISEKT
ncbi:hypothetical protein B711_0657 [Chlamydia psittaci CP3]|nr:hypothetical protein B599_0613 [Chlamydia psittaci MN]AFS27055.1 hypothetical protein B711_0657 [Chlamydia psittaci CP3]EPJ24658.1 hypothetical protein CP09DC77_1035 [Chlamydia psittaci 09DC77]EPJ26210.1 hypothetical protein CP09DC80_1033 [Chlamydia psittaci 09DC80]